MFASCTSLKAWFTCIIKGYLCTSHSFKVIDDVVMIRLPGISSPLWGCPQWSNQPGQNSITIKGKSGLHSRIILNSLLPSSMEGKLAVGRASTQANNNTEKHEITSICVSSLAIRVNHYNTSFSGREKQHHRLKVLITIFHKLYVFIHLKNGALFNPNIFSEVRRSSLIPLFSRIYNNQERVVVTANYLH